MFVTPYQTTVCRSHKVDDIVNDVKELIIAGRLFSTTPHILFVTQEDSEVKPFTHPMLIEMDRDEKYIVADARPVSRINSEGQLVQTNDFQYLNLRCQLMKEAWIDGNVEDLRNLGDYQVKVFAKLMADNLGRRMNLKMETQFRVQVLSCFYYLSLFETSEDYDPTNDDDVMRRVKKCSRISGLPVQDVMEIVEGLPSIQNINMFTETLRDRSQSVRLEKLSAGVIYTMLGGVWFGNNANEQVATALEHPPTWCAMLFMATTSRGYRKTILGQLTQQLSRRSDLADTFVRNVGAIVRDS